MLRECDNYVSATFRELAVSYFVVEKNHHNIFMQPTQWEIHVVKTTAFTYISHPGANTRQSYFAQNYVPDGVACLRSAILHLRLHSNPIVEDRF